MQRLEKKEKSKIRGGGACARGAKHGIVPLGVHALFAYTQPSLQT